MGNRKEPAELLVRMSMRFPKELIDEIKQIENNSMSMTNTTEVIRHLLVLGLRQYKKQKTHA